MIEAADYITITECSKLFNLNPSTVKTYIGGPDYPGFRWSKKRVYKVLKTYQRNCAKCGKPFILHKNNTKHSTLCAECRIIKKVKVYKRICPKCKQPFTTKIKENKICFQCLSNPSINKKNDPFGVMRKPTYRGRTCPCGSGIPLPTGIYRCNECNDKFQYERNEYVDDFVYYFN